MTKLLALLTSLCFAYTVQAKAPLENIENLAMPESVVQAKDGTIYVSEIGEFGKDGDGKISQINAQGVVTTLTKGLDDPKGLALYKDTLYVTDNDHVIAIDLQGNKRVYAAAKDFPTKPQFLNDIEADTKGNLYVSDSGDLKSGGAVFKIDTQQKVSTVVDYSNRYVLAPNGLLYEGRNRLLMVDFSSGILFRINLMTKELSIIAGGFGGGDGIVKTKGGKIYVSDWKNGLVNRLSAKKARLVKNGLESAADMALSQDGDYLIVPLMKPGQITFIDVK